MFRKFPPRRFDRNPSTFNLVRALTYPDHPNSLRRIELPAASQVKGAQTRLSN